MKLCIIHISDIHLKPELADQAENVGRLIASASRQVCNEAELIILAITGDIANSGVAADYAVADKFLNGVCSLIHMGCQKKVCVCMCPGNHDLDLSGESQIRSMAINALLTKPHQVLDDSVIMALTAPQNAFFSFAEKHRAWSNGEGEGNKIAWRRSIQHKGKRISIYSLNTACTSKIKEKKGEIFCPFKQLDSVLTEDDLSISLLHHPYGWYQDINANAARGYIERMSDVILTGHEHEPGTYAKIKQLERNEYYEGGTLMPHDAESKPSFNTVLIDLATEKQIVDQWTLQDEVFTPTGRDEWIPFHKNKRKLQSRFSLKESWVKSLSDAGAGYTHPAKQTIYLEDIFILPELELEEKDGDVTTIRDQDIISLTSKEGMLLILGPEYSGRTALAKTLYKHFYNSAKLPLYIDATKLKRCNAEKCRSHVKDLIKDQYDVNNAELIIQHDKNDKIVLIDNWERTGHLQMGDKNGWIRFLGSEFSSVVILASNEVQYENIVSHRDEQSELWKCSRATIQDCGLLLRRRLVKKWFTLGGIASEQEAATDRAIDIAVSYINAAVESGLARAYSPMVLMMLQTIELKRPLVTTSSSFIHLYDNIITGSLSRISNQQVDPDKKKADCEQIAWFMYRNERASVSLEEVSTIIHELTRSTLVNHPIEATLTELKQGKILDEYDSSIRFKYGYCYYYFTALYISHNIGVPGMIEVVAMMSKQLFNEKLANILLYLTYLNHDQRILSKILDVSRDLFSTYPLVNYDEYGTSICSDFNKINLILPDEDTERNTESYLKMQDGIRKEIENSQSAPPSTQQSGRVIISERYKNDDSTTFDVKISGTNPDEATDVQSLNAAHKTIQILGQLIRNLPGTMPGEQKVVIAEECYCLGLRMLSCIQKILLMCRDEILDYIIKEDVLKCRSKANSDSESRDRAIRIFSFIPQSIAFNIIKQISESVGSSDYMAVYDAILKKRKDKLAFVVVDASVRLDHAASFPEDLVIDLARQLPESSFSYQTFRRFVYHRLALHKTNREIRQRICALLKFKENSPKFISPKSTK